MPSNPHISQATLDAMAASGQTPAADTAGAASAPRGKSLLAMEVRDVHFSYGKNKILKGVSLTIERGKVTTILGSNGCGKSTLFNLMTKNLEPGRGKIFLRGKNIANISLKEFARRVSIVHQYNDAAADITVEKLVYMGRTPHLKAMSEPGDEDQRIVEWALEVTNTAQFRDREVSRLSGGQRQRVWIAMALAQNTKILFLDEPTTYLDVRYQIETLELVRRLNREFGITIVMVLHDINQAMYFSDTIIGLAAGRVAIAGAPEDVVDEESIKELFGIDLTVTEVDGKKQVMLGGEGEAGDEGDDEGDDETPVQQVATDGRDESRSYYVTARDRACTADPDTTNERPAHLAPTPDAAAPADPYAHASAATLAAMRANGSLPAEQPVPDAPTDTADDVTDSIDKPRKKAKSKLGRLLWAALGVIAFALGTLGVVLPILPTVPLYMLALFCFAKGSQKLHDWFIGTKLYHKHLESFVDHRGMTWKSKLSVMGTVTVVMAIAFALMSRVLIGRIILVIVWVAHVIAFVFIVKTDKPETADEEEPEGNE